MSAALRWWWRWAGPNSPMGPISGAVVFLPSLALAIAVLFPPIAWLFREVFGWWWALWLSSSCVA